MAPCKPNADGPSRCDQPVLIANAGMVLLSPYAPALFERLGLLRGREDGGCEMVSADARSRAVRLLQYLVDARVEATTSDLTLNSLLCGVPDGQVIERDMVLTAAEQAGCDDLLGQAIERWPAIGRTSLAGLRETFLQREGRLLHRGQGWELRVERKSADMLIDQLPWTFSPIRYRWMADPVTVTW